MPAIKFAAGAAGGGAATEATATTTATTADTKGREEGWDGSFATARPRSDSHPKWAKKTPQSGPRASPKGIAPTTTSHLQGGSSPKTKAKPTPSSPSLEPSRVIYRGHGRDLDVMVICVQENQPQWPAGRGRPCATSPAMQPRGLRREESDTLRPRRQSHALRSSPMIKAIINGTAPPPEESNTNTKPRPSPSISPQLSSWRSPPTQPPLYEILSLHFDRVLELYPLFMDELSKQPHNTQMSMALDWSSPDKPHRLVSTVESCLAKGFFCSTKKATPKLRQQTTPATAAKRPNGVSPVTSVGTSPGGPRPLKKKVFDASAESFTPPLKPMSSKASPCLDAKAAEFIPPSVKKELEKREKEEKDKKLDHRASEWTPTLKGSASGRLNAQAAEWTPPSVLSARTPSATSREGSARMVPSCHGASPRSTTCTPKVSDRSTNPSLMFEPLPAGPATFASQKKDTNEPEEADSPLLPPGDSFDLYGRQG